MLSKALTAVQAVEGFHLVLEMDYCIYYGHDMIFAFFAFSGRGTRFLGFQAYADAGCQQLIKDADSFDI